jgi:hypothetical protein
MPGGTIVTDHVDTGTEREHHIPVDLSRPIELEIHSHEGDVTVRAADRADVLISHGTLGLPRDWGDDGDEWVVQARDNRIEVRPNPRLNYGWGGFTADVDLEAVVGQITRAFRWGGPWHSGKPGKVRFNAGHHSWSNIVIELPRQSTGRMEIHTASGDLRVEGVTSEIALHTASGDVRVIRTRGDLDLHTASGDVIVESASGRCRAHTANGDVRIDSAEMTGFQIQTASGDILVDALLTGDVPCGAQTASGDVRLTLRRSTAAGEEPAATLAFTTVSGDAHVSPPFRKVDRRRWQSGGGNGGPHIDITTVSGDLAAGIAAAPQGFVPVERSAAQAVDVPPSPTAPSASVNVPEPPAPPAPPATSWERSESGLAETNAGVDATQTPVRDEASRLAVLEAVERGEIDVEEALRRLEAADPNANS